MAKRGEGDPRWIVEERSDSTNVNNWHWREKDMFDWAKKYIRGELEKVEFDLLLENYMISMKTCEIDGTAFISVRKAQLKHVYDIELKLVFDLENSGEKSVVELRVGELNWETDLSAPDFELKFDNASPNKNSSLLKMFKTKMKTVLSTVFKSFVERFKAASEGMMLPSEKAAQPNTTNNTNNTGAAPLLETKGTIQRDVASKTGMSIFMKESFSSSPGELYQAFLNPEKLMMLTNAPALAKPVVNGAFSFLDGLITGTYLKLEPNSCIVMSWKMRFWPELYHSKATLTFSRTNSNGCTIELKHEGVLAHDLERVNAGWTRSFFEPMHKFIG